MRSIGDRCEGLQRNRCLAVILRDLTPAAELELGIRFEEGRGVTKDLGKAKRLYEKAASDDLNYVDVYQTDADGGRITKLAAGTLNNGLPAAKLHLERLNRGN